MAEIAIPVINAKNFGYDEIAVGLAHYAEGEPTLAVHARDDAPTFRFPIVQA